MKIIDIITWDDAVGSIFLKNDGSLVFCGESGREAVQIIYKNKIAYTRKEYPVWVYFSGGGYEEYEAN